MSEERNIASIVQASTQQNNGEKKVDNQRCSAALKWNALNCFIIIIKAADGNTFVNLFKNAVFPQGDLAWVNFVSHRWFFGYEP